MGLRLLLLVARHLGRRPLHGLLVPVTAYFYLLRGPERRASRDFLSRTLGRAVRRRDVFRHMLAFARCAADRFYLIDDVSEDVPVRFIAGDGVRALAESGRAGLFVSAHLGSFEASRVIGPELRGVDLRIVLDKAIGARIVNLLEALQPELYRTIIDASGDAVSIGLAIGDALKEGSWVGFLADRHRSGDRTALVDFLGEPAALPVGPYLIAGVYKAPIIGAFCRLDGNGYVVHLEVISDGVHLQRGDREAGLQALAQRFADRLAHHATASPFAWFNFYDFWESARDQAG